ncbi:hypothetical protein HNO89_000905 [Sporosarcina luteola]|nr:hypothetical protein [Sporosarcina luteola]
MKKFIANLLYIAVAIVWTYGFQWMLILWIGSVRFSAADGPPGDISLGSKLMYCIGLPLFHLVLLTVFFLIYRSILRRFSIIIKKQLPCIVNSLLTILVIGRAAYLIFDFHVK